MANGLRSVLTSNNTGGTGTATQSTFTLAGTEVAGDVAVMFFDQATGTNTITSTPSGVTLQSGPDTSGTTARAYCYTKTLTSGDIVAGAIGPFTWNGSGRLAEGGIVLQGDTETGIVVGTPVIQSAATTSLTLPTVTTTGANWDIIVAVCTRVGSGTPPTVTFPAGYTSDVQSKLNTAAANVAMAVGHLTSVGAAGSYGGGNATYTSANPTIGYTIAVPTAGASNVTLPGDTGAGADAVAVTSTTPLPAETGTGADAVAVSAAAPLTDTGAGTDAFAANATVSLADTATAVDGISVATGSNPSLPDTAAGTDAITSTATAPIPGDTGSATDAVTVTASATLADPRTATDAVTVSASTPLADARTATDAIGVLASTSLAEVAAAADALAVTVLLTLSDPATGVDAISSSAVGASTPGTMRAGTATASSMSAGSNGTAGMVRGTTSAAAMGGGSATASSMTGGTSSAGRMSPG